MSPSDPIAYLRRLLDAGSHNDVVQMIRDRDSALAQWGPVFADTDSLRPEDLGRFLEFQHNRHWWGLQRRADLLLRWFEPVRAMIAELVEPDADVSETIDGLGEPREFDQEVWSPILLVTHPERYGVWNPISESAMRRLGLWPEEADLGSPGTRYLRMNDMLHLVRIELGTDLWTLDALWWGAEKEHDPTRHFVRQAKPAPVRTARVSAPARTKTLRSQKARAVAPSETFICQNCWMTKPTRLASDTPGLCVDCA
jgi:hypothetical protein